MRGYYPGEREYRERPEPRFRRIAGIALGIVLGIAVIAATLAFGIGSEDSIDAPSIDSERAAKQATP